MTKFKGQLSKEIVAGTWLWAGFEHFFVGFLLEEVEWGIHGTFFKCMGLECLGKASILADKSKCYENLIDSVAKDKIEKIAKRLRHNLRTIFGEVNSSDKDNNIKYLLRQNFDGYIGDQLLDVLEAAYSESRYPVSESISSKYPIGGTGLFLNPLRSSGISKFSYSIAREILLVLKNRYAIGVTRKDVNVQILSRKEGKRFCNLFFANEMDKYII